MEIQFREFNPFDLWIWLEFESVPSSMEQQYIEELFNSWFYLGRLGAFNAENLQVQDAGIDLNYMEYDNEHLDHAMMAPMHNMAEFQYEGVWGRCWFDLGTSDLISLDILINALNQLSKEYVVVLKMIIGGVNEDWPVETRREMMFDDFENN
jgi:hypothetical protein